MSTTRNASEEFRSALEAFGEELLVVCQMALDAAPTLVPRFDAAYPNITEYVLPAYTGYGYGRDGWSDADITAEEAKKARVDIVDDALGLAKDVEIIKKGLVTLREVALNTPPHTIASTKAFKYWFDFVRAFIGKHASDGVGVPPWWVSVRREAFKKYFSVVPDAYFHDTKKGRVSYVEDAFLRFKKALAAAKKLSAPKTHLRDDFLAALKKKFIAPGAKSGEFTGRQAAEVYYQVQIARGAKPYSNASQKGRADFGYSVEPVLSAIIGVGRVAYGGLESRWIINADAHFIKVRKIGGVK